MKLLFGLVFVILMTVTVSSAEIQGRISAGHPASEIVPYHARLRFVNSFVPQIENIGSGVLISRIHILTAAVNIRGFTNWSAGFGSLTLDDLIYFEASGAIVHENYDEAAATNNIGILFFGAGIDSNVVNIVPIPLPLLNEQVPLENELGTFVAFGFTTPTGDLSNVLLQAQQQVFNYNTCASLVAGEFINSFCAVDLVNFTTPCGGEQGAGFVQQIRNQPVLVGLVSRAVGACNMVTSVTIFTRVTDFRMWLLTTIGL